MADSLQASEQGLQRIDQARRKKGWNKDASAWIDAANNLLEASGGNISRSTLQRFWRGIPIRQENFVAICKTVGIEDWESILGLPTESPSVSGSLDLVPDSTWVERTGLIDSLLSVLQGQCRILVLAGITGIGKTVLAERLIIPLQDDKSLCSLNLDDGGIGSDFASSGAALIRALGEEPTLEDQKDPTNLLNHILNLLRLNSYRIQIDSLERLLEGNELEGWSDFCDPLWLDLFQQLLAGGECQSQLILTTQDVPGALEEIGSRYERLWHCQAIRGLDETEQLQLFEKRGLSVEGEAGDYLRRIGKLYEGHPLVLRVIAEDLKACGGDVKRYWQQCRFDELEENRPVKLSRRKLQLEVKQRVKASLERLPEDARQLLCRASVYRCPVPEEFWLAVLPERAESQLEAALNLLKARAFADEDWEPGAWLGIDEEIPLRQHNLIRSVAYELLKVNEANWETAERKAAEMWLTAYEPTPNVPNLEKVRGYLEAFYHFCELKDWENTKEIPFTFLSAPMNTQLHWQLGIWGYYHEQISLCNKLLAAAREVGNRQTEFTALNSLGVAHKNLSKYRQAIDYYQQALLVCQELNDQQGEGIALGNLGVAYKNLGNYQQAIDCHQRSLVIAREIGNRKSEGIALGNLGVVYKNLGSYQQAIDCHQQRLTIAREIGDRVGEEEGLGNLGLVYDFLGDYQQAIDYYQQLLMIAREIDDRRHESISLGNLGAVFNKLGDHQQAINFHQQHLSIAREISDRQGEGRALGNLGSSHAFLGDYQEAIGLLKQRLTITRAIGERRGEGIALRELGSTFTALAHYPSALENLQLASEIFRELGDRAALAETYRKLADLHQQTGETALAREYCEQALAIATELSIPLAEECHKLKAELEAVKNDKA